MSGTLSEYKKKRFKSDDILPGSEEKSGFKTGWQGDDLVPFLPPKLSAQEGSAKLEEILNDFSHKILNYLDDRKAEKEDIIPPVMAVEMPAGAGKTELVLRTIQALNLRVAMSLPYVKLCVEVGERLSNAGIPVRIIRGRSQPIEGQDDDTNKDEIIYMCQRHKHATELATRRAGNIYNILCERKTKDKLGNEEVVRCPFFEECQYIRQQAELKQDFQGVTIFCHQYLSIKSDLINEKRYDLLIIDESFWQTLTRNVALRMPLHARKLSKQARPFTIPKGWTEENLEVSLAIWEEQKFEMRKLIRGLANNLENQRDRLFKSDLEDFEFDEDDLKFFQTFEYESVEVPEIHPGMTENEIVNALQNMPVGEAFTWARLWKNLSKEWNLEREELHGLTINPLYPFPMLDENGNPAVCYDVALILNYRRDVVFKKLPIIVIDADAKFEILHKIFPQLQNEDFHTINVESKNTHIRQVFDDVGSKSKYLYSKGQSAKSSVNNRNNLFDACVVQSARHGFFMGDGNQSAEKPVVIGLKGISEFWTEKDGPNEKARQFNKEDFPFHLEHQGNIRGIDRYKHTKSLIVAGRVEPSIDDLESMARAFFYDEENALVFHEREKDGNGKIFAKPFIKVEKPIRSKDGRYVLVPVNFHQENRANIILQQIRESEISQAYARIRPIHRNDNNIADVVILTNIPMPNDYIDNFITYKSFMPSVRELALVEKGIEPKNKGDFVNLCSEYESSEMALKKADTRRSDASLKRLYRSLDLVEITYKAESGYNRKAYVKAGKQDYFDGFQILETKPLNISHEEIQAENFLDFPEISAENRLKIKRYIPDVLLNSENYDFKNEEENRLDIISNNNVIEFNDIGNGKLTFVSNVISPIEEGVELSLEEDEYPPRKPYSFIDELIYEYSPSSFYIDCNIDYDWNGDYSKFVDFKNDKLEKATDKYDLYLVKNAIENLIDNANAFKIPYDFQHEILTKDIMMNGELMNEWVTGRLKSWSKIALEKEYKEYSLDELIS